MACRPVKLDSLSDGSYRTVLTLPLNKGNFFKCILSFQKSLLLGRLIRPNAVVAACPCRNAFLLDFCVLVTIFQEVCTLKYYPYCVSLDQSSKVHVTSRTWKPFSWTSCIGSALSHGILAWLNQYWLEVFELVLVHQGCHESRESLFPGHTQIRRKHHACYILKHFHIKFELWNTIWLARHVVNLILSMKTARVDEFAWVWKQRNITYSDSIDMLSNRHCAAWAICFHPLESGYGHPVQQVMGVNQGCRLRTWAMWYWTTFRQVVTVLPSGHQLLWC